MLKIGIIGLGDIAEKAYLPLITTKDVDLHLCTRNENKLAAIGKQYRIPNLYKNLDAIVDSGIQGAFIHSSTASHYDIARELLLNNIHVFVDKPLTYDYESSAELIRLAQNKKLHIMVGFNRRYAPAYYQLNLVPDINMIVFQKNRSQLPADTRAFIFDDFIHVLDTLLFLFPYPVVKTIINGRRKDGKLYHVTVQFISKDGNTALGIMNRDSGTVEEKLEVFTSDGKHVVNNVIDSYFLTKTTEIKKKMNDWETTLYRRGFDQMIDHFLEGVQNPLSFKQHGHDPLITHKICEEVVRELEG